MKNILKKISLILLLSIILGIIFFTFIKKDSGYRVLKVVDGDTVYIDFNNNVIAERNEKKGLSDIIAFETRLGYRLNNQMRDYELTQQEVLELGYLAKELLKKKVLNKKVKVEFINKKKYYVLLYLNGKLVQDELVESGYVVPYKRSNRYKYDKQLIDKAKKQVKNRELVILNIKNHKYHKLDCKYGVKTSDYELVERKDLPEDAVYCSWCKKYHPSAAEVKNLDKSKAKSKKEEVFLTKPENVIIEKPILYISTEFIDIYFVDPLEYKFSSDEVRTKGGQALIKMLNRTEKQLGIATYGICDQNEIFKSIISAQKQRGVEIRGVIDKDKRGVNYYCDSEKLIWATRSIFPDMVNTEAETEHAFDPNYYEIQGAIMHHKFFINQDKEVWCGSTNTSKTGTGGYNSNVMMLIKYKPIVDLYLAELNQMYEEQKFHNKKKQSKNNKNIKLPDGTIVSVYFQPQDNVFQDGIIPLIDKAEKKINISMFYLTHSGVIQALIRAKQRNLDIKIILDATSAENKYTKHHILRKAEIPVKIENWGGKNHLKNASVDGKYFISGSGNWTHACDHKNDDNILIIENSEIAEFFDNYFAYLFASIPEKWLSDNPIAESPDSVNSCFDNIDNDHDGFTDGEDFGCGGDQNFGKKKKFQR